LPDKFYAADSNTTKAADIKQPERVSDFIIDLPGYEKVTFTEPINLAAAENAQAISEIEKYITFEKLAITIDKKLKDFFSVPLEIIFYNFPFVSDPAILLDGKSVTEPQIEDFYRYTENKHVLAKLVTDQSGKFTFTPALELNVKDNETVYASPATFWGRISDPVASISYKINGIGSGQKVDISSITGEFSITPDLVTGENILTLSAESQYGTVAPLIKKINLAVKNQTTPSRLNRISTIHPLVIVILIVLIIAAILLWVLKYVKK